MKHPFIQAIGTAVPENRISQEEHFSILESANGMSREEKLVLRRIYSRSGIEYRHSVLNEFAAADKEQNVLFHPSGKYPDTPVSTRMDIYECYAGSLCLQAVEECLAQLAGLQRTAVTHVITFSCTGMYAPGLDIEIIEKAGLPRSAERTCINFMGCYAAINALKAAYHICRSEEDAVVLIAGVELCSLHYQKSNEPNQVVANALFADGAAAAIISAKDLGARIKLQLNTFYSEFEQSAAEDMVWRIGNVGFDLKLSPEVPGVVKNNINELVQKLFARSGLKQVDIDYYAIHPGGMKILEACEQSLHVTKEQNEISYGVLRDFGNMSSVTILFVLKRYLDALSETDKGKHMLACAFGPGITMESMIAEIA